jgi:hypothetical protein
VDLRLEHETLGVHQDMAHYMPPTAVHLNRAGWDVCAFFEDLAHLQRIEALPAETVWNSFGSVVRTYWPLCKPAIEKMRRERKVAALYEEFEHLSSVLADLEREQDIEAPTREQLRQVIEDEAIAGEDEVISNEEPIEPQ